MTKSEQARLTAWRLRMLQEAADRPNVARVCRRFGISRKSFYKWKRRHAEHGDAVLMRSATGAAAIASSDGAGGGQQDPLKGYAVCFRMMWLPF